MPDKKTPTLKTPSYTMPKLVHLVGGVVSIATNAPRQHKEKWFQVNGFKCPVASS